MYVVAFVAGAAAADGSPWIIAWATGASDLRGSRASAVGVLRDGETVTTPSPPGPDPTVDGTLLR